MILNCKLLEKLWIEILNISTFLINISPTSIKLFTEFLTNDHKTQILYKAWYEVLYVISRYLIIIEFEDYLHIKDDKEVNFKKLIVKSRKMTIIEY